MRRFPVLLSIALLLSLPALLHPFIDVSESSSEVIDIVPFLPVENPPPSADGVRRGNNWLIRTVDWIGIVGQTPSLAMDPDDIAHICYYDYTGQDLRYARWNGSGWDVQTVDSEDHVGKYTSLALDELGMPHMSYYDITGKKLKYASFDGEAWDIETVNDSANEGSYSSLVLDGDGHPHISYFSVDTENLRYATHDGFHWYTETVDTDGGDGGYSSIALDSQGRPHICYCISATAGLRYTVFNGTGWENETLDPAGHCGSSPALVLAEGGVPHVTYFREDGDLVYTTRTADWVNETVDDSGTPGYSSMAMDAAGALHMSYFDASGMKLKYAMKGIGDWETGIVDQQGKVGEYCSLALDSQGVPRIAYYDDDRKDLRYAARDDVMPVMNADITVGTPTTGDLFTIAINASDDNGLDDVKLRYTYDFTDYYRVSMERSTGKRWSKTVTVPPNATVLNYTFIIYDEAGNMLTTGARQYTVTDDDAPVAGAGNDRTVPQHETVLLEGNGSTDNVGITDHEWSFDYDGETRLLSGMRVEFTFDAAGAYNVTLEVRDGAGNNDTDAVLVTVLDTTSPFIAMARNVSVNISEPARLDAGDCRDNVGIVNYTWTFFYEGSVVRLYGRMIDHTFDLVGIYNITLNVTDAAGNGAETILELCVRDNLKPEADAGPDIFVDEGKTVIFSGAKCVDNVEIVNYTWAFDHGENDIELYGRNPRFTFKYPGNYSVILMVKDGGGNSDADEVMVVVKARPKIIGDDDAADDEPAGNETDGGDGTDDRGGGNIGMAAAFTGVALLLIAVMILGAVFIPKLLRKGADKHEEKTVYDERYEKLYGDGKEGGQG